MTDKKEWHENIPENSVLCKKLNGAVRLINKVVNSVGYYTLDGGCDGIHTDDLTPLTPVECF